MRAEAQKAEEKMASSQRRAQEAEKRLEKYQKEYIRYEEQAELEIVTLREEHDRLSAEYKEKERELVTMGEQYL
jgi:phage-related minor tail protein